MVRRELWVILILIIIIIVLAKFACRTEVKVPVNPAIGFRDSAAVIDSAQKNAINRLKNRVMNLEKENVMLHIAKNEVERQLTTSQQTAARLATGIKIAKTKSDTVSYVTGCDSLVDETAILNAVINTNQYFHEQLVENYESTIKVKDSAFDVIEGAYAKVGRLLNQANTALDDFHRMHTKALRKNNKSYNVSIGAGVGIGPTLKPIPVVALTVNKTIFRF
jgi:hypothetical protein